MKTLTFTQAFKRKYPQYKYVLSHIKAYNNDKDANWSDFKKLFLINLVQYFQNAVSPNSARLYCAYLKSLFNDYSDEVQLPCKEYNDILSLKKVGVLNIYLTTEEIMRLIDYVPKNEIFHSVRNQFVLSCLTGMRHSDVIRLDSSNINGNDITYLAQKTKSVVNTINSPITEQFVSEQMNIEYHLVEFNNTIRSICKEVGITDIVKVVKGGKNLKGEKWEYVSSHTARRSFCTLTYLHTKDIILVSKLAGHSSIEMTQRYICTDYTNNQKVLSYFNQFKMEGERVSQ